MIINQNRRDFCGFSKENKMKKTVFLPQIILISCNSLNPSGKKQYVTNFKKDFKKAAFCHCVLYGYNNKKVTSFITEVDKSFYNYLAFYESKKLDSLTIIQYKRWKNIDSLIEVKNPAY